MTMCPPGYYHNGFITTPELGHTANSIKVDINNSQMANVQYAGA